MAETVGGSWIERARRAAVELAGTEPTDDSRAVQLLRAVQTMFEEQQTDRLSSETIVQTVAASEDRPSPEGAPLTKAQLARLLAPFGVRPTIVHRTPTQVIRGYRLQDFRESFARYL